MRYIFIIISLIFLTACNAAKPIPKTTADSSAKILFENKQYKESIAIFKEQNTPESQYYLGKAYFYGFGVEKDFSMAYAYAVKSAEANYVEGINLLGLIYANGAGVEKDQLEALVLYKKAAKLGNIRAMYNLADGYRSGGFLEVNINKSMYWFNQMLKHSDPRGYWGIADLYKNYLNDNEQALKNYLLLEKSSFNIDDFDIIYEEIADLYRWNKEFDKAYSYYKKAIKHDNTYAIVKFYFMVSEGYKKDELIDEAIQYLKRAVELRDKASISFLYNEYYRKQNNHKKALEFALTEYSKGNIEMGCQVASYFGSKELYKIENNKLKIRFSNTDFDYTKSYKIANEIISKNPTADVISCYSQLIYFNKNGIGLTKDIDKAIQLAKQSFETSRLKAYPAKTLAELYLEELKDYVNAEKWYQTAYEITKDKSYLTKVDEFKKSMSHYKDKDLNEVKQKIYPIIDSFTKKEKVAAVLETKEYYFISTSQKSINMYDKNSLELKQVFRGWVGNGLDGLVDQMAYDEKKKLLYCAGFNSSVDFSKNYLIKVFDIETGKIVNTINNKNAMKSSYLNISDDGKYLVSINNGTFLNIIDTDNNEIQHYNFSNIVRFTKANIIQKNNDYLINVLGNNHKLYTFSLKEKRQVSINPFTYQTQFKTFNRTHALGILENKLNHISEVEKIQYKNNQLFIKSSEQNTIKNFNLKNLTLSNTSEQIDFVSKSDSKINIRYKNLKTSLAIYKNNQLLSNIELFNVSALKYKIINDKYIILTTSDPTAIYIFNLSGRPIANLIGFNSLQTNIIYQDGQLLTYGSDNIVHFWNIDNLDKLNRLKESYNEEILNGFNKFNVGNILEMMEESDENLLRLAKLQSKQDNLPYTKTPQQLRSYMKMSLLKKEEIFPLASLYVKKNTWIIFNHKGYFSSSKNGKNLIKYHLNQGLTKEAKIIDNEQIFEKFYRPDIIKKLLAKETVTDTLDIKLVLQNINAPSINMISNKLKDAKNLELTYQICDNGSGVTNTSILVNNVQKNIANTRGFSIEKVEPFNKCTVYKNIISLQSGKNTIAIKSFDNSKTISTITKAIEITGKFDPPKKSNLHFLSIAVANYRDESLRLKYSVSDVNAIKDKIKLHSRRLFENIYTYDLHESEVTLNKLDAVFNKIAKKTSIDDVFILYIAGHGVTSIKDGLYYFLPYDIINTSSNGLINSAISVNNIKHQLGKINANKSLILLDTCESGGAIETLASRGLEQRTALERLSYATGRNYIVASSKNQAALEGYQNHGVFTYSVLQAFDNAYFGNDTTLTVTSLASFIEKTVPQITKEKFHYEQFPQKYLNGNDFPIGMKGD